MNIQFTTPYWLWALVPGAVWVLWLAIKSDAQLSPWRRWLVTSLRLMILLCLVLALAGIQWKQPKEGLNVFFLLDRSQSVSPEQQERALKYVNETAKGKTLSDRGGVIVFGAGASIETMPNPVVELPQVQAVISPERTDLGAAIRLAAAALPEHGQRRLVVLSDGNENSGDAMAAVLAAKPLGVTVDVVPLSLSRGGDVSVQKLTLPSKLKVGQAFEVKILLHSDREKAASVRLFRNDQLLGEQPVQLTQGKNLFAFPQKLEEAGFYNYQIQVDVPGDTIPQNNKATSFASVRGDPTLLLVSADPAQDANLAEALRSSKLTVKHVAVEGFPETLAEMQSYDSIFISNIASGDLTMDMLKLLEIAVRDFGVGLVCVGGDQTYAAGAYRGTPLETILPVDVELSSKKVLPPGALVLVIDKSGSMDGEKLELVKSAAIGAVRALGDSDYVAVIAFDGQPVVVAEMQKASNRTKIERSISGIVSGGGTAMYPPMVRAYEMLHETRASLKHVIVLTDGESQPGDFEGITKKMAAEKMTVSTVAAGEYIDGALLQSIANAGKGRFYHVRNPTQIPQVFIKETAVILKSAISEEPFQPRMVASTEVVRGFGNGEFPTLLGHVATEPKSRAELALVTGTGDPLLAHWNFGLGRSVAFTSDAKPRWAKNWMGWSKYRQFWSQVAQWSLRKLESANFNAEMTVEKGDGVLTVEAMDDKGDFQNFLNLEATVVSPKGDRQRVRLEQTAPGHYEVRFPTKEVGAYVAQLSQMKDGNVMAGQVVGTAVNYSPEFEATETNIRLMQQLAEAGEGRVINPQLNSDNPFVHDRVKTFQPVDLWEWLLKAAILLFPFDVGLRRIHLDKEEWMKATATLRRWIFFWKPQGHRPQEADESLAALLNRRDQVRATQKPAEPVVVNPGMFQPKEPVIIRAPKKEPKTVVEGEGASEVGTGAKTDKVDDTTTTSRLLEAKKRAQKRR
ncbi:MAG TPA: VWA domain-containing protein [Verrucomicrobiae bacterium]